jgi:hypothetical protein
MSTVNLIAVETGLLLSAMAFAAWLNHAAHRAAMEVYSGVRDGVRLSRRTRRLFGGGGPGLGQAHSSLVVPITAAGRPDGQCLRVTSG